jgi:RNA polymerase sigma-70 factor (ECF subfamily)
MQREEDDVADATSSQELVRRFQNGHQESLERLWARYLPRLKRWAHGRLPRSGRGAASTDDLIQDAFVRSLAHLRTIEPRSTHGVFAYLRMIILNQVRDYARQGKRRPPGEELQEMDAVDTGPSVLDDLVGRETMDRYTRALATLAEEDQDIILAFVELRLKDKELAELFQKPSSDAARMARNRAVARLARAMESFEGARAS